MSIINDRSHFMSGIYVVEFGSGVDAQLFIKTYSNCPVWPVVTKGTNENEVFILAIEFKEQRHGDFSLDNNTLVVNPHYLGAKQVRFKRDDSILELFGQHMLETGYSDSIPCGADCKNCPSHKNPCMGCPAYFKY